MEPTPQQGEPFLHPEEPDPHGLSASRHIRLSCKATPIIRYREANGVRIGLQPHLDPSRLSMLGYVGESFLEKPIETDTHRIWQVGQVHAVIINGQGSTACKMAAKIFQCQVESDRIKRRRTEAMREQTDAFPGRINQPYGNSWLEA